MKNSYLKIRTMIVLCVIAVFAAAIYPLTPLDFYQTMRETIASGMESQTEKLIESATAIQQTIPGGYPSTALLKAAEKDNIDLRKLTGMAEAADNSEVASIIRKKASGSIRLGLDLNGGVEFVLDLQPDYDALASGGVTQTEAKQKLNSNFDQYRDIAMEALRKRLESKNIFETEITPFGSNALSLKAPIVSKDEKEALQKLIQMSSKLQFRMVHPESASLIRTNRIPAGFELMHEEGKKSDTGVGLLVSKKTEMDGNGIEKAFVSRGELGQISIALEFNTAGTKKFAEITGANVSRQMAVVLDGRLYCAPRINMEITGGKAEITGQFSMDEAKDIADALTNGSFPFQIDVEAVYDTAPTLGADNVQNGIWAAVLALALLTVFMTVYYRKLGIVACSALAVNVVLILGAMAAFGATMTMPGIAGIILTLGMAVDANVLVFERMREELEVGKPIRDVVDLGFQKAYSSVLDGNLTTLVIAIILMYFGTGAIKGFAVSLSIGIVASLFTALFMTRVIFDWLLRFNPEMKISMLKFFSKPHINFIRQSRTAILLSLAAIILSAAICLYRGGNMLSVDFTGGTLLSYSYDTQSPSSDMEELLANSGIQARVTYKSNASARDNQKVEFLIRQGTDTVIGAGGIQEVVAEKLNSEYPKLLLTDGQVTVVGGMVGGEMTRNAIISILLAFLGMTIYVTFRYEFCYAAAGILALVHDVIISLGVFALMGRELSLPVVAGLLTIIGYSINDTIVIFDRIREEKHLYPDRSFIDIVNSSLNRTLSRTILTSLTTFIVVVTMFLFGGIAINDFVLVIMLGIIIGSYSSLYIASPIVVAWQRHAAKGAK